ncbi:MAG: hypothetical protein U5K77_00015 [Candidatus Saccharibacteria bacterium]|nr:hypothetical protein [Candidatus Saccharibacteria bacterium]
MPKFDADNWHYNRQATDVVEKLAPFTYLDRFSQIDGVFSPLAGGSMELLGNLPAPSEMAHADLINEDIARSVLFYGERRTGKDEYRRMVKNYRYKNFSDGVEAGDSQMSVSILQDDEFRVIRLG